MVPRTGPLSASSALAIRSWYQRGKSSARGVSTRATAAHPRALPDHPAAQDDAPRLAQHAEVGARVAVVDHQVGQAPLDQSGEAEPLPGPPGAGAQHLNRRQPDRLVQQQHLVDGAPVGDPAARVGADVDRNAGLVGRPYTLTLTSA